MVESKKNNARELFLPIIVMVLAGGCAIGSFAGIRRSNTTLLQQVTDVAGEETEPTIGRMISIVVFLIISVALGRISMKKEKKDPENLMPLWCLSAFGGTLLWTVIGEASWHFGVNVPSESGGMTFVNFPRIECMQGIQMFAVMLVATILMCRKAGFAESAYLVAFVGNWGSHLLQIATYPIVLAVKPDMDVVTWYRLTGISNTVIFTALWLYLCFGTEKKENKYFASVLIYDAIGSLLFGTILGET